MGYLYGAAVQGIQQFIFETNRLKEIIGASELVEHISTRLFRKFIEEHGVEIILNAAGNIKIFAKDKHSFIKLVREFPKTVMEIAPGISISQAVVFLDKIETADHITKEHLNCLEDRLKSERNRAFPAIDVSGLAIKRSPRTGKPACMVVLDQEFIDYSTKAKLSFEKKTTLIQKLAKQSHDTFSKDMKDISGVGSWVAVVHADGNSLGRVIQRLNNEGKDSKVKKFSEFSKKLELSTIGAAQAAFKFVIEPDFQNNKRKEYQIRPIVLGGDDLTIICRADLALKFTTYYLKEFQRLTADYLGETNMLTACAGIAFIKESFPFHYGVNMAEQLCAVAKQKSKRADTEQIPASIAFHKVQSSFVDDYQTIIKRELTAGNVSFNYGPYKIDNDPSTGMPDIEELLNKVKVIKTPESPKSGIRKWLSALHEDPVYSGLLMNRIRQITAENFITDLGLETPIVDNKTVFHDVLAICSLEGE